MPQTEITAAQIIPLTINNAKEALRLITQRLNTLSPDDPEYEVLIEIEKDTKAFIRSQAYILFLMNEGRI